MKNYLILLLVLFQLNFSFGQNSNEVLLASMKIKEASKKVDYAKYIAKNLSQIDTIKERKDSIVIKYIAKNGAVIRQEINQYVKADFNNPDSLIKSDSLISFYDTKEHLKYSESWGFLIMAHDSPEGDGTFAYLKSPEPYLQVRVRMEFDKMDRVILEIILTNYFSSRKEYYYDAKGNKTTKESKIEEYQFWD